MVYYKKFNYTSPINTAFIFLFFVIAMDAGLFAPVFEKSYGMFKSILGTWIPFSLIFLSTYIIGLIIRITSIMTLKQHFTYTPFTLIL
jgi:hypothetical protein